MGRGDQRRRRRRTGGGYNSFIVFILFYFFNYHNCFGYFLFFGLFDRQLPLSLSLSLSLYLFDDQFIYLAFLYFVQHFSNEFKFKFLS